MESLPAKPKADILVVDDTPINLHLLNEMLGDYYKIRLAPNGAMALAATRSTPPDLILLDIVMPEMDGYQVAAQLKSDPQTEDIPIIFVSALDDPESIVRAFAAGGVDYVAKPVQEKEAVARINTHLALRDLQRELRALYRQAQDEISERKRVEESLQQANKDLRRRLKEIKMLQDQLHEQAIRDYLTGLYNRRYLQGTLERDIARARRDAQPVGIIIMDTDRFKRVNDTYGHTAGDLVLQTLGELLKADIRTEDIACRYGGEEFVVVMPGASLQIAYARAEMIRAEFDALRTNYEGREIHVTVSLGVAAYPEHGIDGETVLIRADRALYQAKQAGRNRVAVYKDPD